MTDISSIQTKTNSAQTSTAITSGAMTQPTLGNYLFVLIGWSNQGTDAVLSGTPILSGNSGAFTVIDTQNITGQAGYWFGYRKIVSGDTTTITWTGGLTSARDWCLCAEELTAPDATSPIDKKSTPQNSGAGTATALDAGTTALLTQLKEYGYGVFVNKNIDLPTADNANSLPNSAWDATLQVHSRASTNSSAVTATLMRQPVMASAAAIDSRATLGTARAWCGITVAIKGPAQGGQGTVRMGPGSALQRRARRVRTDVLAGSISRRS